MEENKTIGGRLKDAWNRLHNLEGDKVILIIVLLLILASFLTIFSSTPLLPAQESRLATMKEHGVIAIIGIGFMTLLYHFKISWLKYLSQTGFILSFLMLLLLLTKTDIGIIHVETRNSATRNFEIFGKQIHVFEIVKVAMVMYIAWAMNAIKEDKEARKLKRKPETLSWANSLASKYPKLKFLKKTFWKRMMYVYAPSLIIIAMLFFGSGSSSILMALVLIALMIIGGMPMKELATAGAAAAATLGIMIGISFASDGKYCHRAMTFVNRIFTDYDMNDLEGLKGDAYYDLLDDIRQPESAKVAVHEGKILGKGIGNSTQKYKVDNIYGDYMYSFIIEEYGLGGGILVLILYISLLARSSIIARMCENEFEKYAIGGLAVLISGQAFLHILVNVDIGPMTGQTLPLISHGSTAFVAFCIAFGIILSISRLAKKKIENFEILTEKSINDIEANKQAAEKSE